MIIIIFKLIILKVMLSICDIFTFLIFFLWGVFSLIILYFKIIRFYTGFDSWVGKIPWRRKWQPPPVILPGKSHGWRSLAGTVHGGHKELDMTERLHFHFQILYSIYNSGPQPFWHQGVVLWKMVFPWTRGMQAMGSGCKYRWSFTHSLATHLLLWSLVPKTTDGYQPMEILVLEQGSPAILAPGTHFVEDNFFTNWGRGQFQDDSRVLHLLCTFFFFNYIILGCAGSLWL